MRTKEPEKFINKFNVLAGLSVWTPCAFYKNLVSS